MLFFKKLYNENSLNYKNWLDAENSLDQENRLGAEIQLPRNTPCYVDVNSIEFQNLFEQKFNESYSRWCDNNNYDNHHDDE